ncbi:MULTISPECIES: hypothetical protein [Streptomyces]|nr:MULTISPECIES: hypothetical protein [Streptomyces]WSF81121.1 hypothetical protein OG838_35725 [Streptomyces globisporus]
MSPTPGAVGRHVVEQTLHVSGWPVRSEPYPTVLLSDSKKVVPPST